MNLKKVALKLWTHPYTQLTYTKFLLKLFKGKRNFAHVKYLVVWNISENIRSSRPEVFLRKGILKICNKFTGEHPCRSMISAKSYFGMGVLLYICCIFQNAFF